MKRYQGQDDVIKVYISQASPEKQNQQTHICMEYVYMYGQRFVLGNWLTQLWKEPDKSKI